MRTLLVRHPAASVAAGICYGRLDLKLQPGSAEAVGVIVAAAVRHRVRCIWTSPAGRCRAVADAIGVATGLAPVIDERLQELDFGGWEGMRWDDVPSASVDAWAAAPLDFAPPGGESGRKLLTRVAAFADDLRRAGEDAAVIAHGGPLRLLPALLRGETPDLLAPAPALGSVTVIVI